jgi:drug/metabolite transporter (DMT)-like permease
LDWLILTMLAVSGLLAFTSMTHALKLVSPNLVSSLRTLELVLAYAVQAIVLGENPHILSCFGGGLIFMGVLVLTFQGKISQWFLWRPVLRDVHYYQTVNYAHHGFDEYSRLYG